MNPQKRNDIRMYIESTRQYIYLQNDKLRRFSTTSLENSNLNQLKKALGSHIQNRNSTVRIDDKKPIKLLKRKRKLKLNSSVRPVSLHKRSSFKAFEPVSFKYPNFPVKSKQSAKKAYTILNKNLKTKSSLVNLPTNMRQSVRLMSASEFMNISRYSNNQSNIY